MSSLFGNLFSNQTPEQREVVRRKADIDALQTEVAQRELDLATLQGELQAFRAEYFRRLGPLYRERDALNVEVARLLSALEPEDLSRVQDVADAQDQAAATDEEIDANAGAAGESEGDESFNPSDELKAAYRHSAKLMHPDRAMGDEDRVYRNEMMAQVNVAYQRLDLNEISRLVSEFHAEANIGGGIGRELVLLIRQEAALRERLTEIGRDIAAFDGDETMKLKAYCAETKLTGRDALAELAAEVRDEIAALSKRAVELRAVVEAAEKSREASVVTGNTATPQARGREGASGVHIHRTDRGDFVRSKSELVIANVLHALSLDYKYEQQIVGRNTGGKMLPDFVFISSQDELIVWEHLGMLDKPEYRERWQKKRQWYEDNDFVQGVNFFVSRDQSDGSLDSHVIRKIALLVKTLL